MVVGGETAFGACDDDVIAGVIGLNDGLAGFQVFLDDNRGVIVHIHASFSHLLHVMGGRVEVAGGKLVGAHGAFEGAAGFLNRALNLVAVVLRHFMFERVDLVFLVFDGPGCL